MNRQEIENIFDQFKQVTALVVGDVMIDRYLWGRVDRISPEAPVPVVSVVKKEDRLGGAANVAMNIQALGGKAIMCSVTGDDEGKMLLDGLLKEAGIGMQGMMSSKDRITTSKTRVISSHQHMVRIDEEQSAPLASADEKMFVERIASLLKKEKIGVILLEDYNKGVMTPYVIQSVIQLAIDNKIPVAVDPKREHFFLYKGVTLFKPNLKELTEGLKLDRKPVSQDDLAAACNKLEKELQHRISLITLSERGVFVKDGDQVIMDPAHIRNIADVSGAGDTVVAVAALCLAVGVGTEWMARLANLSGGLVCEHVGVVPIDVNALKQEALDLVSA